MKDRVLGAFVVIGVKGIKYIDVLRSPFNKRKYFTLLKQVEAFVTIGKRRVNFKYLLA